MYIDHLLLLAFLGAGMILSVYQNKLTVEASLTGGSIGYLLYLGAGSTGVILMAAFFVLGILATAWKLQTKVKAGLAETNKGRRRTSQVLANAGVPALAALLNIVLPGINIVIPGLSTLCLLMVASAFASATSDTFSSELGNIYGRKFYNITTFKKDTKGENGVVSVEGLLAGIAGAALIALLYSAIEGCGFFSWIVLLAGVAGNLFDSLLGAILERRKLIGNDMVNVLNTLFAALIAALAGLFHGY